MNTLLQAKLDELKSMQKGECWYIVKQETSFVDLCYLVSFLQEYQLNPLNNQNLEQFIKNKAEQFNQSSGLGITTTHRALRVAVFFGLISNANKYENAQITPIYNEIKQRCNGQFENSSSYQDIIQNQIEKMFISSDIDEENEGVRSDYRLYPVMLLYKILLELHLSGKEAKISDFEYKYFVATTKTFEGFLDTLLLIQSLRKETNPSSIEGQFTLHKDKVDNRLIQALRQLETLDFNESSFIKLKAERIKEIAEKLYIFEQNPNSFNKGDYNQFLQSNTPLISLSNNNRQIAQNLLLYGVAGVGKSHTISKIVGNNEQFVERIVFHPDYLNTDFVGQIMPTMKDDKIIYDFKAGSFTKILKKAIDNPNNHHYLVIEEINRGNAPAIFGEIFQLLDRNENGESSYKIAHEMIAKAVFDNENKPIYIPNNLTILATMNTADQNVFTLDTAFQRRWTMRMIENNIQECHYKDDVILDTGITWEQFNTVINNFILQTNKDSLSSEDKRLGAYFVRQDELKLPENMENGIAFAEKVIKYLWDDVFKFNKSSLFDSQFNALDNVLNYFKTKTEFHRFEIFNAEIHNQLKQG